MPEVLRHLLTNDHGEWTLISAWTLENFTLVRGLLAHLLRRY